MHRHSMAVNSRSVAFVTFFCLLHTTSPAYSCIHRYLHNESATLVHRWLARSARKLNNVFIFHVNLNNFSVHTHTALTAHRRNGCLAGHHSTEFCLPLSASVFYMCSHLSLFYFSKRIKLNGTFVSKCFRPNTKWLLRFFFSFSLNNVRLEMAILFTSLS